MAQSETRENQLALEHLGFADALAASHVKRTGAEWDEMRSIARLKLVELTRRYEPSHGSAFSSFAFMRIKGALLDEHRANQRVISTTELAEDQPATAPSPFDHAHHSEIWSLVEDLPEREQAALRLRFAHDWRLQDIGAYLSVTESRASQLVSSGLNRLRTVLSA